MTNKFFKELCFLHGPLYTKPPGGYILCFEQLQVLGLLMLTILAQALGAALSKRCIPQVVKYMYKGVMLWKPTPCVLWDEQHDSLKNHD